MKKLISLLFICLFLFSCQSNDQESDNVEDLTVRRNDFAVISQNGIAALDATWESPNLLVLTVKQDSLKERVRAGLDKNGNQTYEHQAAGIARFNATLGSEAIRDKICIKILYPDGQELAYECSE